MTKKLHSLLTLFFIFKIFTSDLSAQTAYWMQKAGGITPDEGSDISIDANGNTYTTGYFTSAATFGTTTLNSSGVTDIFITKVDNLGIFKWAIKAGGPGSDRGLSIKADAQGNTYVTGFYYGTATFGSQTITSTGLQDLFIAKYNNAGILQWVKSAGGSDSDIGNGINIDNSGNVVVTGEFKGSSVFGSFSLTSKYNSIDVFTTKLDANGNFLWAKKGSAHLIDRGIDVACDAAGNVYVTGQFTDTITFDIAHNNNMYNVIFLVKYNSSGQEQWFRKIGGGTFNISSGIAVDANSNIYLTGDFTGNLIFFNTTNTTLTNIYANKIFVAKYDSGGNLLWAHADGSSGELTSKNIALDATGNAYIVGNFKCVLNEYADKYGQGTFNSVGFWDIFVSKYNASGAWQWSRQCASVTDDNGAGITANNLGQAHITGSFYNNMIFPTSANFLGYNTTAVFGQSAYCSDLYYGYYNQFSSTGNSDILIAKNFDPLRETYDYYVRNGAGCNKPFIGVCITSGSPGCPDSVAFCGQGNLYPDSHTSDAGPDFNYLWSNGATTNSILVTASGYYWVKQTSADGCFVSNDTIYATINPVPAVPTISDSKNININAIITKPIILCGDSVLLTGGNFGTNTHFWTGPTGTKYSSTDWATLSGWYYFSVTNQFGCSSSNLVEVIIDTAFSVIGPKMICIEDPDKNDSISICKGSPFTMYVYDSIANPLANGNCIPSPPPITYTWSATPDTLYYTKITPHCINSFTPTKSGTYHISTKIKRKNNCDVDSVIVTKSIYVNLLPLPIVNDTVSITGKSFICPGDSVLLIGSGTGLVWSTGSTNDSIWVYQGGTYSVSSTKTVTNSFGCTATASNIAFKSISIPLQPLVTMNPSNGLICPNDSVQLFCDGSGTFQWQGPSGPIGGNTSTIYVNIPGFYYCIRTDLNNCTLVSNTVLVNQYATPYLLATPSTVLCEGDSLIISVITNASSTIQWQSPFSGNSPSQIVTAPGTYTCLVTSCGIQTLTSVTITMSTVNAQTNVSGPLTFCDGDSVIISTNGGMANYSWQPGGYTQPSFTVYKSGSYTLTTTDNYGCTTSGTPVTVTVTPNNTSVPTTRDTTICPGDFAKLVATGTGNLLWYTIPNSGNPVDSGQVFTTPNLHVTTSYYLISQLLNCKSGRVPVKVNIDDCDRINIPNVFTPNGDGTNEIFFFDLINVKCFHCKIYNRWGLLVYEWDDPYAGWDGTIMPSRKPAVDGVYYYLLDYCNYSNKRKVLKGFIQLLGNK